MSGARCWLKKHLEHQVGLLFCREGSFAKEPKVVFQKTMGRAKLWRLVAKDKDDFLMELVSDAPDEG